MSLFLKSDGMPCFEVDEVNYVLIGATHKGSTIKTKNLMTNVEQYGNDKQMIRIKGENVYASPVEYDNVVYWYCDIREITKQQMCMAGYIGGILTGNLRSNLNMGGASYYDEMEKIGEMKADEHQGFTYSYVTEKVREKISQDHHYHVRLVDILGKKERVHLTGREAYLCMQLDRFNTIEATHVTFLTYFRSASMRIKNIFYGMLVSNERLDTVWLKSEGQAAKQSAGMSTANLSELYELNVLLNRIDKPIDWQDEMKKRVEPDVTNISPGAIYKHALTLFSMAKAEGKKPLKMKFDEYWMQRAIAMPAGAIHDEDPVFKEVIKQLPREIKNKKGFSSVLTNRDHTLFKNKEQRINSYTSTKYEWGKTRALYGCDYTSHIHSDFGLLACEETFPFFVPTGNDANAKYIKEIMRPYNGFIPVCYDYEDFNSQHTFAGMQSVIRAWLDTFSNDLSSEQCESVEWTINSVCQQYVNNGMEKTKYRTKGTLFSGWRLTSFINTALNYCYLAEAGINQLASLHMHNGDDVFATVNSLHDALSLYVKAKKLGIRANMTKMSIGTIAEFLRTDMRAKNTSNEQYLTRGVSTFVHSRIESSAPTTYRNLVEAYTTRFNEVVARGGDRRFLHRLYRKQLFFARKMFNVTYDLQEKLLNYDPLCGGIKEGGFITHEVIHEVDIDSKSPTEQDISMIVSPGVNDYTTFLSRKFPTFSNLITKKKVLQSILSGYNIRRKTIETKHANIDEILHKRAMRGAWNKMTGIALINRVRMGISNIMVVLGSISSARAKSLDSVDDPIAWLALLLKK